MAKQRRHTNRIYAALAGLGVLLALAGCPSQPGAGTVTTTTTTTTATETGPSTETTDAAATRNANVQRSEIRMGDRTPTPRGSTYTWQGFPQNATSPEQALILVEKIAPQQVKPNETYNFEIIISNRAGYAIDNVALTEELPDNFTFASATPSPEVRGNALTWGLGTIEAGQKRTITVTGQATYPGTIRHTGETDLNFDLGQLAAALNVTEPTLSLTVQNNPRVIISETIPVRLTFRNTGTAPVYGTRLLHTLPSGLLTEDGRSRIEVTVGDLNPGDTRTVDLVLRGEEVGNYETTFTATASEGIAAEATMRVAVQKPRLRISGSAQESQFVGKIIRYEINLTNEGDAIARETVIRQVLSDGTTLAGTTEEGQAQGNVIIWRVGDLAPGQTKTVEARVVADRIMRVRSTAEAQAVAADSVSTVLVTDVAGIAALLLEVGDEMDPVPVGDETVYIIKTSNTGSLVATGIRVKCILEDSMEFINSTGATKGFVDGNEVRFEPLPALEPQAEATWRVIIRAVGDGDVRFTVSVDSDQLSRPVTENESTKFYN